MIRLSAARLRQGAVLLGAHPSEAAYHEVLLIVRRPDGDTVAASTTRDAGEIRGMMYRVGSMLAEEGER